MPRALGVFDLPGDSTSIWLSEVTHPAASWTTSRYERAAYLLGRLSGSPAVAARAMLGGFEWTVHDYVNGRLRFDVVPALMTDEVWQRPGVAEVFDAGLRERMRAGAARLDEFAAELCDLPRMAAHGDASPNNLLSGPSPEEFVLIDYGFFMPQPVGFDLGQLVAGETQLGRGPDDLPAVDAACQAAYVAGLADEGIALDPELVRRSHALHLFVMAGISALPGAEEMSADQLAQRAGIARLSLDLLDATSAA